MRGNLTVVFLLLVFVLQTIGLVIDFPWEGIIIWTLSIILILFAAYYTKYWKGLNK